MSSPVNNGVQSATHAHSASFPLWDGKWVLAMWQWSLARKVIVGLVMQWPCITGHVSETYGLNAPRKQNKHHAYTLYMGHTHTQSFYCSSGICPGLPGWAGTCTSSQTTTPTSHHSVFYRPDAFPAAQLTASEHWRKYSLHRIWHTFALPRPHTTNHSSTC